VHSYFRKDGTFVLPYFRSSPDGNPWNNWSALGNIDPYTGTLGRRVYTPLESSTESTNPLQEPLGGDVFVHGYIRSDGSYVPQYYRSAPDGNFWNNWSTIGNVNPYTGELGTRTEPPQLYLTPDVPTEQPPLAFPTDDSDFSSFERSFLEDDTSSPTDDQLDYESAPPADDESDQILDDDPAPTVDDSSQMDEPDPVSDEGDDGDALGSEGE
jgi:hypothetical protein